MKDRKMAVAFPGQGIQKPGMACYLKGTSVWHYFEEASDILGYDLEEICLKDSLGKMNRTQYVQPAVFVTCYAFWQLVQSHYDPVVMLGHSLGEMTAFAAAGAFSFEEAVRIVAERGRLMGDAAQELGGMAAVIGLDTAQVETICEEAARTSWVQVANYNTFGQIVVSGFNLGLEIVSTLALKHGAKRVIRLNVDGPFHSRLMTSAAHEFAQFLANVPIKDISVPVLSNHDNVLVSVERDIRQELIGQITCPVQFVKNIQYLQKLGITEL